ncbi:hypothetical protein Tco_0659428 [Tanacetum coccineum]
MGELTFFLGLQVKQKDDGIFISQDKYVADILKKFDFVIMKTTSTLIETNKALLKDEEAEDVDVHLYRSMIGSLMYLTASRPDIMFAVCACARFQVTPKVSHLHAVKRIFRYLKGQPKLGLWYPRDSPFDLEAFSDSDYAGASLDRKSTTGGCQFLGKRLISWQCKKQTIVANSTTEAEYVAAANCCGQVLWIQNQMLDYGFNFMNTKIYIDNESTICIVKNPVFHSKTKHIEIRHHFIKDSYEKRLIQVIKIHTDHNVVDLLTKAFDVSSIRDKFGNKTGSCKVNTTRQAKHTEYMVLNASPLNQIPKRGQDTKIPQSGGPPRKVSDDAVHKELDDRMERATTTSSSLEVEHDSEWRDGNELATIDGRELRLLLGCIISEGISMHRKISDGVDIPIFATMLVQGPIFQGKGSTILVESHHTPTSAPSTSQPPNSPPSMQTTHVAKEAATMPHDSPLPRVHLLGSDEGSMTLHEVMLIMKVNKLENRIKSSKARRRVRLIVSEDEDDLEDPSKQGRKIA